MAPRKMEWREAMKVDERTCFEAMFCLLLLAWAVHRICALIIVLYAACWRVSVNRVPHVQRVAVNYLNVSKCYNIK
jgi:hypothetical protein